DMHEITHEPVVTSTKTIITEVGQDGQVIGELNLMVDNDRISGWKWTLHHIDDSVKASPKIAKLVAGVRATLLSGPKFKPHIIPFNGTTLSYPLDLIVGQTA